MKSINFYDNMKAQAQKNYNSGTYWADMVQTLQTKFTYGNLDPIHDPPPEYIEKCLITSGLVGFGAVGDDVVACLGSLSGEEDYYYRGKDFEGCYANGNISGKRGVDVAVGFNNSLYLPDLDILRYESIFTEIDVSEKINVLFARLLKVPVVGDEREKEALKDVFSALIKGDFGALVSKNLFMSKADGKNILELLELTDVDDIKNLQYLSQYRDNIMKRFYCRHGHSLQTTGKIAQQTTDEVHGMDSVSMIYPFNQLEMRRRMCEEVNRIFSRSWEVDFSEAWKVNEKQLVETVEEDVEGKDGVEDEKTGNSSADSTNPE